MSTPLAPIRPTPTDSGDDDDAVDFRVLGGSSALSSAQSAGLLTRLRSVDPALTGLSASWFYLVRARRPLDRDTGEIVWSCNEMKSGYVTLLLDGDRLIASTNGYIYCLDPLTGEVLWHNPMRGYGMGSPAALTSVRGQGPQANIQQAAHDARSRQHQG